MEIQNLRKVIKISLAVFIFTFTLNLFAQNEFYVYSYEGSPFLVSNDSVKPLVRGLAIKDGSVLTLSAEDEVQYINKEGYEYIIDTKGSYPYVELTKYSEEKITPSFAKKFMAHIWRNFTNNVTDNRSRSGVVYRGDEALFMKHPVDSAQIFGSEIRFTWYEKVNKKQNYYLILKDKETGKSVIIGSPATSISLLVDGNGSILKRGQNYEWAVTETPYLPENNIDFFQFSILTETEYNNHISHIKTITKYLKQQGLSKNEIQATLCEVYKMCY